MTTAQEDSQRLLNVAEVAERLRVSPWTIYRHVAAGELDAFRIGTSNRGPLRFEPEAVQRLLRPVGADPEQDA
jgi:excisionase family DNA binding protein